MSELAGGKILIANPFLKDLNFLRSVILLCNHQAEGSFGFVLNQELDISLTSLMPELDNPRFKVYKGGPVQIDTLHYLHTYPQLITGGMEVMPGVYMGGNFESLKIYLNNNDLEPHRLKFFLGYSGWGDGQLAGEMLEKTWITANATTRLLFEVGPQELWKEALIHLGHPYSLMINYPIDPQLN